MNIEFDKNEYRLLIDLLHIAGKVLNAHESTEFDELTKYSDLVQKVYSFSKEINCDDITEYKEDDSKYDVTSEYEDTSIVMEYIDEHEEQIFWEGLSRRLASRDFNEQEGEDNIITKDSKECASMILELESWYGNEFFSNGLKNLRFVKPV